MAKLKEAQKLRGELSKQADTALAKSADALEGSPELPSILELDPGELQKLRERLLEKYFPFRNIVKHGRYFKSVPIEEALTETEKEDFYWKVWRNVELMRSDMSGMSAEAQEDFLNGCYRSIQFGFESHYEQSQRQTERAKKRHAPDYEAQKRALSLAREFRDKKPTERIGKCVSDIELTLIEERSKAPRAPKLYEWIKDLFPAELRRRGRPTKK